jgi:hypothetical protein
VIHYFVAERLAFRMNWFLAGEPALAERLVVVPYEHAWEQRSFVPGTYLFGDLEWLTGNGLESTIELWERLSELEGDVTLLNDPARALRRYELLRHLHARGVNRFNAFRVPTSLETWAETPLPLHYPVFLRCERTHVGNMSDLLYTWEEVVEAVPAARASGEYGANELLVVEWCDTSDANGVFRKYGAFVIGETIVARHLVCSRDWVVKDFELLDDEFLCEARAYVAENPHADVLREIAKDAAVQWGRFDYSFVDGQPQIWEINLNPTIIAPGRRGEAINFDRLSIELHRVPMRRIATALLALESAREQRPKVAVSA